MSEFAELTRVRLLDFVQKYEQHPEYSKIMSIYIQYNLIDLVEAATEAFSDYAEKISIHDKAVSIAFYFLLIDHGVPKNVLNSIYQHVPLTKELIFDLLNLRQSLIACKWAPIDLRRCTSSTIDLISGNLKCQGYHVAKQAETKILINQKQSTLRCALCCNVPKNSSLYYYCVPIQEENQMLVCRGCIKCKKCIKKCQAQPAYTEPDFRFYLCLHCNEWSHSRVGFALQVERNEVEKKMREISDATEQRIRDRLGNKTKTEFAKEEDFYNCEIDELLSLLLQIHYLYPALCKRYRQALIEKRHYQDRLSIKKQAECIFAENKPAWSDGGVIETM